MSVIRVEPRPHFKDLFALGGGSVARVGTLNGKTLHYMGSGKAAIAMVLEYLRGTRELPDKMAEVVVPAWIGNPVYHQVNWFGFPTLQAGPKARAIMIYHQYGFPQDMDRLLPFARERDLIVIEDCAHAPDSAYKGQPLGSLGRFAIYSFSKFAFCYALGGVAHTEPAFGDFIEQRLKSSSRTARRLINALKIVDEANFARRKPLASEAISVIRKAAYGVYGDAHDPSARAITLWRAKRDAEFKRRRELYAHFRQRTDSLGLCSHLEADGVTPYAIPARMAEDRLGVAVERLLEAGFRASINHFDFNRSLLEPDFRKTILLSCHGDFTDEQFERMTDIVVSVARGAA